MRHFRGSTLSAVVAAGVVLGCFSREPRDGEGDGAGAYALRVDVQARVDSFQVLADDVAMTTEPLPEDPAQALFVLERSYSSYSQALGSASVLITVTDGDGGAVLSSLEVHPGECDERCGGDCGIGTVVEEKQHLRLSTEGTLGEACVECLGDTGTSQVVCP